MLGAEDLARGGERQRRALHGPASASSASVTSSTSVVTATPSTGWSGTVSIGGEPESMPPRSAIASAGKGAGSAIRVPWTRRQ